MTELAWTDEPDLRALLEEEPILLIGRRRGKRIETRVVNLHEDTFPTLRSIGEKCYEKLGQMSPRTYEPSAELETGEEYFSLLIEDLVLGPADPIELTTEDGTVVQIQDRMPLSPTDEFFESLSHIGDMETLGAAQLYGSAYLFYAIAFERGDKRLIFFRKQDPTVALKRGVAFSYGDTLRKVDKPDIVLDEDVDFVVTGESIFVARKPAFEMIVSDLRVALQDVPAATALVVAALASRLPLQQTAIEAIRAACTRRYSLAVRLRGLAARIEIADIDAEKVRASMSAHGEDSTLLISAEDEFDFGEEHVGMFLDVVESRWFEDDYTKEKRRADRLSTR